MELSSGQIAHALIGQDRRVSDVDSAYAVMLGRTRESLVGCDTLDFTHDDDRPAWRTMCDHVWRDGGSRSGAIRHIHANGSAIWVDTHVSTVGTGATGMFVVSSRRLDRVSPASTVQAQWRMARLLSHALDGGKRAFGKTLVGNPATEMLLLLYIAEAEARPVFAQELTLRCALPWPLALRWFHALDAAGFVEAEVEGGIAPLTPMRLTLRALGIMESLFAALFAAANAPMIPA